MQQGVVLYLSLLRRRKQKLLEPYILLHMENDNDRTPSTFASPYCRDYYKLLEIDYDASDEDIRLNYRRLALKWHPDKFKGDSDVTSKFQEINEAYREAHLVAEGQGAMVGAFGRVVLSDPTKRHEYDSSGNYEIDKCTLREYLARFKGMILTCNGLGMNHTPIWTQHIMEAKESTEK